MILCSMARLGLLSRFAALAVDAVTSASLRARRSESGVKSPEAGEKQIPSEHSCESESTSPVKEKEINITVGEVWES